jgi:hypothetical protein
VLTPDLSGCKTGEIELTIQIVNATGRPLSLPWNPDGAVVVSSEKTRDSTFRDLSITVLAPKGNALAAREPYGSVQLFGAGSVENSEVLLEPNTTATLRNIRASGPAEILCRGEFAVAATLSIHQLVKVEGGYALHSRPLWKAESP